MPPPDDGFSLKPIEPMRAGEVPRAGSRELTQFKHRRDEVKSSLSMWTALTAITAAIALSLATDGFLFYGLFLLLSLVFGSAGIRTFLRLAGIKSWRALPDGATETTALLEDGLTKSIRAWNAEVDHWNKKLAAIEADVEAWRLTSEDPGRREEGWSEASHAMESEALLARGKALMLERRALAARRAKIRRAIGRLDAAVRKAEQESQEPDPEPDDG